MGLAERKMTEAIKNNEFKAFVEEVKKIVGKAIAVDVDWGSLENDASYKTYVENNRVKKHFFDCTLAALNSIASDDMGKTALKEKLKKISFTNKSGNLAFENGVLSLENALNGNGVYDDKRIQETLEAGL